MVSHSLKIIRLLCLGGIVAISGCMSARTTTNLKPASNPDLKSSVGKFYIEGVKYTSEYNRQTSTNATQDIADYKKNADEKFGRNLLTLLRKECTARYPGLFSNDSSSSIPLWIEVNNVTTSDDSKTLTTMLCTVMICGIVLPLSIDSEEKIELNIGVWNGVEGIKGAAVRKSFTRTAEVWTSILPTALITIPGESDFPKISGTVFDIERQTRIFERANAQQIATALAVSVAEKDANYWTAIPLPRHGNFQQTLPETISTSTKSADPF